MFVGDAVAWVPPLPRFGGITQKLSLLASGAQEKFKIRCIQYCHLQLIIFSYTIFIFWKNVEHFVSKPAYRNYFTHCRTLEIPDGDTGRELALNIRGG